MSLRARGRQMSKFVVRIVDGEREILRQLGGIPDEPILLAEPYHPMVGVD